jgi:hypothetical protein
VLVCGVDGTSISLALFGILGTIRCTEPSIHCTEPTDKVHKRA